MAEATAKPNRPVGYFSLLRDNSNYRSLWIGEIISLFGDWFNLIASAALISNLTDSGLAVGALFVVRMLAPFLVSPIAGVFADRFNRKRLLIASDLIRAIIVFGFLFVRDSNQVWLLFTLTALQLALSGFFYPARNAILPSIVSRNELGAANTLSNTTWSVMLALGAALGGVVAGLWGIYPAFVIDALTFLLSAFFISLIRYQPVGSLTGSGSNLGTAHKQYIEGLRFLTQHVGLLMITLHKGAHALIVGGAFQVIQVALAERVYVIGEGGGTSLGLFYAIAGVGTGIGPILARKFTGDRDRPLRVVLAISYAITALGLMISAPLIGLGVVLLGTFIRACGGGINWVFSTQLLLHVLPDNVRGRVFSSEFAIFTLASALGAAAGGWLLDNTSLNISAMIWGMAGLILIPGGLWTAWISVGRVTTSPIKEEISQIVGASGSDAPSHVESTE